MASAQLIPRSCKAHITAQAQEAPQSRMHALGELQRHQGWPPGQPSELRPGIAQAPHRAVKEGGALPESCGVFVSRWHHGSPAHRYALYALQFVQEVNGVPTPDLEAFVKAISSLVRLMCLVVAALSPTRTARDILTQKPPPSWASAADSSSTFMPSRQLDHQ